MVYRTGFPEDAGSSPALCNFGCLPKWLRGRFAKPLGARVRKGSNPLTSVLEVVRLVEGAVLKTVGPKGFGGSIPSASVSRMGENIDKREELFLF